MSTAEASNASHVVEAQRKDVLAVTWQAEFGKDGLVVGSRTVLAAGVECENCEVIEVGWRLVGANEGYDDRQLEFPFLQIPVGERDGILEIAHLLIR